MKNALVPSGPNANAKELKGSELSLGPARTKLLSRPDLSLATAW